MDAPFTYQDVLDMLRKDNSSIKGSYGDQQMRNGGESLGEIS